MEPREEPPFLRNWRDPWQELRDGEARVPIPRLRGFDGESLAVSHEGLLFFHRLALLPARVEKRATDESFDSITGGGKNQVDPRRRGKANQPSEAAFAP